MKATRNTVQRELILNTVRSMTSHPSAEEVYASVVSHDSRISKGTVYRNLALLSDMGEIRKIPMPGICPDRYDFNLLPHYHAVCRKCGKIVDVHADLDEKKAFLSGKFKIESVDIVISGLCEDCRGE